MRRTAVAEQAKPNVLYIKNADSGESKLEELMLLRSPRKSGYRVWSRGIDLSAEKSNDEYARSSMEDVGELALGLYSGVVGKGLVIASYDESSPIVVALEYMLMEWSDTHNFDDLQTYNLGERSIRSKFASLYMGHKLVQLIQQQPASQS
jgi:hypothetical protein